MLAKLLFLLPIVAFGFGGPNCPSEFSSESCTKKSQCAWCNSTDGNDQLCFNKQSIPKLNKSEWTCSANFQLSTSHLINTPVPSSAYFSVYQQSNAKHCVELLCDSEESYNSSCFQIYWGLHGYQYDKYDQGLCGSSYNFVNLEDTICNTSLPNKTSSNYGCSIFTLGTQD